MKSEKLKLLSRFRCQCPECNHVEDIMLSADWGDRKVSCGTCLMEHARIVHMKVTRL